MIPSINGTTGNDNQYQYFFCFANIMNCIIKTECCKTPKNPYMITGNDSPSKNAFIQRNDDPISLPITLDALNPLTDFLLKFNIVCGIYLYSYSPFI